MASSNVPATRPPYETAIYDAKVKDAFLKVADETTYLKEIIFAYQAVKGSEHLQACSPESLRNAVVNVALTGATLNPALHQAYLVPRKGKACLDISYRGLVKIATESRGVYDVDAVVVHDKDEFHYEMGLEPVLRHIPCLDPDPGPLRFVYAIAILPGGIKKFIVLNREEIEKVRKTSAAKSGPWVDWYEEMARKTAVKKLYKLLPQTDRMSTAVSVLNEHEGIVVKTNAEKIQERFGVLPVAEAEFVTCPIDDTIPVPETCAGCEQKEGCRVFSS